MHNLKERNSIERKHGQEKHAQAKSIARQEIKQRVEGRRIPCAMVNLLSPWFVYLTFIQLKEDKDAKKWNSALAVIDNLIAYCSITRIKGDVDQLEKSFNKNNIIWHIY